jgi:hypothetical protein
VYESELCPEDNEEAKTDSLQILAKGKYMLMDRHIDCVCVCVCVPFSFLINGMISTKFFMSVCHWRTPQPRSF